MDSVSSAIKQVDGIASVSADVARQLVYVEGSAAPSAIVSAIEGTGREAVLRGSGRSNSAGVCILETHAVVADPVKGLARLVQVGERVTVVDVTVKGLGVGRYWVTVRERGDVSCGAGSTGGVWEASKESSGSGRGRGELGMIEVGEDGRGSVFLDWPVPVWEVVGRSMVVSRRVDGPFEQDDANTLVGVIARSAGVWENDKTVCSCSGKTVWEERKEQQERGMM